MDNNSDHSTTENHVGTASVADLGIAFSRLLGVEGEDDLEISSPDDEVRTPDDRGDEEPVALSPESVLEAALFVGNPSGDALSTQQLAELMRGVDASEIDTIVNAINSRYRESRCPFIVVAVGGGFILRLREELAPIRERFYGRVREARLSQNAIDALAIIAYHQPVGRARIEELRGRPLGSVLTQLVRRKLLSVQRTKEKPRMMLYSTTNRFLELFGLEDIDDLPNSDDA